MLFTQDVKTPWANWNKILFRFLFLYGCGYIFFMFAGRLFEGLFVWVGETIFNSHGRLEYFLTGSGDTTMAYISLFVQAVLAVVGAVLWSVLDRKRPSYNQLFYWFTVILRIFIIFFMFTYGFVKIFKTQFAGPSLMRLMQPIGEMSPMGLAWTYMAQSEGFNMFAGGMEVLGGLLLIPRRTQTLGAMVTMGVMLQVAMMNFFYDIPVKLFSVNLILLAAIIFFADIKRFVNVFIRNRAVDKAKYYKPSEDSHYNKLIFWLKVICTAGLITLFSFQGYSRERNYGDKRQKPPLYGIWEVTHFVKNGDTLAPLVTDKERWRYLIIDRAERASIKLMNDSIVRESFTVDTTNSKVYMASSNGVDDALGYKKVGDSELQIKGISNYDSIEIHLKAKDLSKIPLINRGFHWINEYPHNR